MLSLLPDQWSNLVIMTFPSISHAQRVQFLDSMSSLAQSIIVLTVLFSNSSQTDIVTILNSPLYQLS